MNIDNVECQICKQEMSFGRIKSHIKARHKEVTLENYIKLYWNTLPLHKPCEVCNKNIVYKYQTCSKECRFIYQSNNTKGIPKKEGFMDEKHRSKLSKSHTGKIIPKEVGEKISASSKGVSRNKGNNNMLGKKQSQHQKNTLSKRMKKYYNDGNEPWTKNNKHTIETIEKIFKKRKINNLEQLVFDLLIENNIDFKFQFFLNDGNKCKSYDFKISGSKILVEIDGDFWHGNPNKNHHFKYVEETKINDLFKENLAKEKGYTLLRFWETDIKANPQIIINKIKELL